MFAGLGNQISGFVAQKMGKGEGEGEVPNPEGVEGQENGEGEVPQEGAGGGAMGGAMGFAQGLMQKANAVKEGVAAKAGTLGAGNLQAPFGGGGEQAADGEAVMEGQEGEVPAEGVEGEGGQTGAMGFAAGLMMKAHSIKENVKEKSSGMNIGNVQSMAGGVMGQVQGLIPGMRREEEVPDPAPAQDEYQEYAEEGQQYQEEQQYTE